MWNDPGNEGITYTLDKVVYGSEVVTIPEPTAIAMIALAGVAALAQRRQ